MPILSIRHVTRYSYRKPVRFGEHRMMFRPLESFDQRLLATNLKISPRPSLLRYGHDVFGNCIGVARFDAPAPELTFDSRARLEHSPLPAFAGLDGEVASYGERYPFDYSEDDLPDLLRSMARQHPDPEGQVDRWAQAFLRPAGCTRLQTLLADITQAIYSDFRYETRIHGPAQTAAQTLATRTGTCRDFALLMMEAVRALGFAAQFVSGYLYSPPLNPHVRTRLGGGHTHAWVRVYLPVYGWVEFDPTNGIVGNTDLVRVAIARDPRQALPLWGSWSGDPGDFLGMEVDVDVVSEHDAPRGSTLNLGMDQDLAPGIELRVA